MAGVKWSNDVAFPEGAECEIGDKIVGLRSGANYKFDFPSDGIKDGNSNYLVGWGTTGAASTDYMLFTNGEAGTPSNITMTSSGADASLDIILKGTGVLDITGLFNINGSTSINAILDEDNMASDSATALATQQSIKAYVDATGSGLVDSVSGTTNEVDVDNTDPANPIVGLSSTIDAPGTFNIQTTTAINAILDEDNFASDSPTALATQQSIKAYVDNTSPASTDGQTFSVLLMGG